MPLPCLEERPGSAAETPERLGDRRDEAGGADVVLRIAEACPEGTIRCVRPRLHEVLRDLVVRGLATRICATARLGHLIILHVRFTMINISSCIRNVQGGRMSRTAVGRSEE